MTSLVPPALKLLIAEDEPGLRQMLEILFRHDPVGICMVENPHRATEYSPEVDTILPRLYEASSENDVLQIVYEEFVHWFDSSAGPQERYAQIAAEIWQLILIDRQ